ncbi:MAG: dienelactone hydrolase family protein [Acidobacteriota bacterium]|nr:MAG: dienelactone hydrolase family protein [Acidobacteriota bacterium]
MSDQPADLDCIERGADKPSASIIWLHGLGADGYDFVPIVEELGLPESLAIRFVFPHADRRPVTLNQGMVMRAWYDIRSLSLEDRSHDERGILRSAAQVKALIDRECARGVASERIVVAGFSQGGALALHTALRYRQRLAGLIGLSCYVVLAGSLEREAAEVNAGLPVFLGHGTFDPIVPVGAGELTRNLLTERGHRVEWHTYPVPHGVHPDEIAAVGRWLRTVL